MSIAESVLPEFDHEMANTRVMLSRVPEDRIAWKPHQKSMSLGDLATHVANIPMWGLITMKETELDMNPGSSGYVPPKYEGHAAMLKAFDDNVKAARDWIAKSSDADFMVSWTLKMGDKPIFSMPRVVVLRSFVLNHIIHHRGQLSVYLRQNDVSLPSIYGPSADEGQM